MEIKGQVEHITEVQTVGKNNVQKQTLIVKETTHGSDEDYKNNSVAVDFMGEKVEKLQGLEEWDIVTVFYNIKTNEYNGRRYNRVNAWNIEVAKPDTAEWKFGETEDDWNSLPF